MSNLPLEPRPTVTHPYAVRFELKLGANVELKLAEEETRVAFGEADVLSVRKIRELPLHQTLVQVDIEAFASAADAERAGQLLAFSLMWLAASKRVTIGFAKHTGIWPFAVRDRTRSGGIEVHAEGRGFYPLSVDDVASEVARAYQKAGMPPDGLLTSMQFFAAAGLESSDVARFIGIMTALEALAEQDTYGADVETALLELARQLESNTSIADPSIRSSLAGQIRALKRESVGRAIKRLVKAHVDDKETLKFVEESYGVRSKMLHEGARAIDLGQRTNRLQEVLRQIYASITGLTLTR